MRMIIPPSEAFEALLSDSPDDTAQNDDGVFPAPEDTPDDNEDIVPTSLTKAALRGIDAQYKAERNAERKAQKEESQLR